MIQASDFVGVGFSVPALPHPYYYFNNFVLYDGYFSGVASSAFSTGPTSWLSVWGQVDAGYAEGSGLRASGEDIADGVARRGSTELTWGEWWTNVTGAFTEYPQGVLQTAKGYFWNGPKNMVVGLWNMTQLVATQLGEFAYDPVGRATAFGNAVYDAVADPWETTTHIVDMAKGIWSHYEAKLQTLEGQGEAAFDLASLLVPTTAGNAKVGSTAAKSSKISKTIRVGVDVAEEATVGGFGLGAVARPGIAVQTADEAAALVNRVRAVATSSRFKEAAHALGIADDQIAQAIGQFEGLASKGKVLWAKGGIGVILDRSNIGTARVIRPIPLSVPVFVRESRERSIRLEEDFRGQLDP